MYVRFFKYLDIELVSDETTERNEDTMSTKYEYKVGDPDPTQPLCPAMHYLGGGEVSCTREEGHKGEHVAGGGPAGIMHVWANEEDDDPLAQAREALEWILNRASDIPNPANSYLTEAKMYRYRLRGIETKAREALGKMED